MTIWQAASGCFMLLVIVSQTEKKFMQKFMVSENNLCGLFTDKAATGLNKL